MNPTTLAAIDEVLKEFGEEAVLILTDGRTKYKHSGDSEDLYRNEVRAKAAIQAIITQAVVSELENIPNFEVDDVEGNAAQYIIDRIKQLKGEE